MTEKKALIHIMFIFKKKILKRCFQWLFKCEKVFGLKDLKGYDQIISQNKLRYLSFWFKKYTIYLEFHWTFFEMKK